MDDKESTSCAHESCSCSLQAGSIVSREGRNYCSERCADNRGCDHEGCNCGAFPAEEGAQREHHEGMR
jgi:hypothetical protein